MEMKCLSSISLLLLYIVRVLSTNEFSANDHLKQTSLLTAALQIRASDAKAHLFRSKDELDVNEQRALIVCTPLSAARAFKNSKVVRDVVTTIYTSKREGDACFTVTASLADIRDCKEAKMAMLVTPMPALAKLSDALFSNPIGAVEDGSLTALSSLAHPRFNVGEVRRGGDYENAEEDALLADLAAARGVDMQELKEKRAEEAETEGGDLTTAAPLPAEDFLVVSFGRGAAATPAHDPARRPARRGWVRDQLLPSLRVKQKRALVSARADDEDSGLWFRRKLKESIKASVGACDFSSLALSSRKSRDPSSRGRPVSFRLGGLDRLRTAALEAVDGIEKKAGNELIHDGCFSLLLEALAENKDIVYVEPGFSHAQPLNSRITKIIQDSTNAKASMTRATPIWDMGINGTGQIVGVADTGLDRSSCFFSDASGADVTPTTTQGTLFDRSQRKVVQYVSYVDGFDYKDGHGTHVAGTAVGDIGVGWTRDPVGIEQQIGDCTSYSYDYIEECRPMDDIYYYLCNYYLDYCIEGDDYMVEIAQTYCVNSCMCTWQQKGVDIPNSGGYTAAEMIADSKGVAFGGKLAVFDFGDANGYLLVPDDLYDDLYPPAYMAGARVHTNSWGASYYGYTSMDIDTDSFLYDFPAMTILYAAGNDGYYGSETVGTPGQSISALTVGASMTGRFKQTNGASVSTNASFVADFSSTGPSYDGRIKPEVVAPGHVAVSASSAGYPSDDKNKTEPTCGVVGFSGTSMATPATAGAAMLVREYFSGSAPDGVAAEDSVFAKHLKAVGEDLGWNNVCLPGYPCNTGYSLTCSGGALVKAMLIHGTVAMSKWHGANYYYSYSYGEVNSDGTTNLGAPPDNIQGFGRVTLDYALLGPSSTPGNGGIGLWAGTATVASDSGKIFTFHVINTDYPLKVTVSWYDPPNTAYAQKQLLHDLDLMVTSPSGEIFYSNQKGLSPEVVLDELNPTEKVSFHPSEIGDYTIDVVASTLTEGSGNQEFAIVITGAGYYIDESTTWADMQTEPGSDPGPFVDEYCYANSSIFGTQILEPATGIFRAFDAGKESFDSMREICEAKGGSFGSIKNHEDNRAASEACLNALESTQGACYIGLERRPFSYSYDAMEWTSYGYYEYGCDGGRLGTDCDDDVNIYRSEYWEWADGSKTDYTSWNGRYGWYIENNFDYAGMLAINNGYCDTGSNSVAAEESNPFAAVIASMHTNSFASSHKSEYAEEKRGDHITLRKIAQGGGKEKNGRRLDYNQHVGKGWCYSYLDDFVGKTDDAHECWEKCHDEYGDDIVAIDWWDDRECYCQNDCLCMADVCQDDFVLLIEEGRELPASCDGGGSDENLCLNSLGASDGLCEWIVLPKMKELSQYGVEAFAMCKFPLDHVFEFEPTPNPTHTPSMEPTIEATISVSVKLSLTASAPPTDEDVTNLREVLEDEFDGQTIKNFDITYESDRRVRRKLLAFTWAVSFDILDTSGDMSSLQMVESVTETLESSEFEESVMSAAPTISEVQVEDVEASPSRKSDNGNNDDDMIGLNAASATILFVVGGIILVAALTTIAIAIWSMKKSRSVNINSSSDARETEMVRPTALEPMEPLTDKQKRLDL